VLSATELVKYELFVLVIGLFPLVRTSVTSQRPASYPAAGPADLNTHSSSFRSCQGRCERNELVHRDASDVVFKPNPTGTRPVT
jgi:hypothetical protein